MSIQTEIDRIITAVSAAHQKVAAKGGTTAQPYLVGNLADAIDTIPVGAELPALTNPGKASDALSGKEFIDGSGNKVTGTIATKTASNLTASGATVAVPAGYYASQATKSVATATQATPSIEVSSAGLITAKATQSAGYVSSGTKSATKQLTTQAAQTITPGASDKTISSGRYLTGTQTIKGDANLVAGNIKSGVSIFGVTGNYEGSGGGSTAAPENCTVTLYNYGLVNCLLYSSFEDGEYKAYKQSTHDIETTIFTAIRGSTVILMAADSDVEEYLVAENCTLQYAEYESGFGAFIMGFIIDGDNAYIEC